MPKKNQIEKNIYFDDGANGGCFFAIEKKSDGIANLEVGWSCVIVHPLKEIPVTWLCEVLEVATSHKNGIAGFLRDAAEKGGYQSYALQCDPDEAQDA